MSSDKLAELRKALDAVDRQIVDVLAERQRIVQEVGHLKRGDASRPFRDVERERALIDAVEMHGQSAGLHPEFVRTLFRGIIDYSVRRQEAAFLEGQLPEGAWTVAYLGGEGSYSHQAAIRHFQGSDRSLQLLHAPSFDAVAAWVADSKVDRGILPIENSTAGSVHAVHDLLGRGQVHIVGEEIQPIDHCLLGLKSIELHEVRRIYGHPQALAQCSEFLRSLTNCRTEAVNDTASAARKVRNDDDLSSASLGNDVTADSYGLTILQRNLSDLSDNMTRFVVIAKKALEVDPRIPSKTSLHFTTKHEQGSLLKVLQLFSQHGLNLTKLESRPNPNGGAWQYSFYLDFEGQLSGDIRQGVFKELVEMTGDFRVLGTYPIRDTVSRARSQASID